MAPTVGHAAFARALRWLARPPPALRFALKLGTAMSASIWIAFASGLDWGLTIWITVMFVTQPNQGASIKKGLTRICGSVAAALVSIAIYGLFAQQPPLMLASTCAVFALAIYGMTGPRYQYAWLVFGFTTILILLKALAGSDRIETLSFERATLTALGVLIVFVADSLFWPVRAEQQLREGLAERSRQLGAALMQHLHALQSGQAADEQSQPPSSPLIPQLGLVDQYRDEIGATPAHAQALSRIALLLEGLASRVRQLVREPGTESGPPAPPVRVALAQIGSGLDAALAETSRCLTEDCAPQSFADSLEHSLAGFEGERMATPVLGDVVALLRRLEAALLGLVKQDSEAEGKGEGASAAAAAAAREWFHPDPIRLRLALRAGIAGGGAIIATIVMGWSLEEDMLPMIMAPIVAFILAGVSSTRGAGTMVGIGMAAGILLGWLIADLASVFLFTHLDRMPLSLVYPFVVAGGAGYLIVSGSPLGPLGVLFGLLTALLPVFIGDGPPQNVDTAYGLVCGLFVGLAAGLIAQRFLWPQTAMQIFTGRAAGQLDLCVRALSDGERSTEGSAPSQAAAVVSAYAKQLTQLGQLHAQAHHEPVERALDDGRRAELLVLIQDLFDASLQPDRTPGEAETTLAPLREALARQDEALVASLNAAAGAMRGSGPGPDSSLGEARAAVAAQIDARRSGEGLAPLAASRQLVESQLRLEAWLTDWQQARAPSDSNR